MDCSKCRRGKTDISKGTNPLIAERNHKNQEIRAGVAGNDKSRFLLYESPSYYLGYRLGIVKGQSLKLLIPQ